MYKDFEKHYKSILKWYSKAEKTLKEIEHLNGEGLHIPTINELRYAGRHIIDAINSTDKNAVFDDLKEAENHCVRALYDVCEVGILFYFEKIRLFDQSYKFMNVSSVFPGYINDKKRLSEIQEYISTHTRKDFINDEFKKLLGYLKEIKDIYKSFEVCTIELDRKSRAWKIGFIIPLIGVIILLVFNILKCT